MSTTDFASLLDRRPVIVAIAGPNGAGKSTFYNAHLKPSGLPFINADLLAAALSLDPYAAAEAADRMRRKLAERGESFIFETVFSDPVGDKLQFLRETADRGYTVVLIFIAISGPLVSEQRVSMRVAQGGHDVPTAKLYQRFSRTFANLKAALASLPLVYVLDNSSLADPYRLASLYRDGIPVSMPSPIPEWLRPALPDAPETQ